MQELEYIPPDIDLTVYIPNARALGSSDLAILLGLVIREIHKLRLEKIEHELGDSKDSRSEASIRATEDDLSHHRLEEAYLESRLINSEARSEIRARIIDDDNMFLLKLSDVLGTIVAQEDKTGLRLGFRDAMDELHRGAPAEKALQRLSKSHRERTITETPLQKLRLIILQKVLNSTKEGNRLDYAYLENEASVLHSRYSS